MSLFSELKRRNVIRVGILYLVASWPVLQVTEVSSGILGLPDWTSRLVLLFLAIGFPIALVMSWIYELTPDGIKLEKDLPEDYARNEQTTRKLDVAIVVLLVIAIAALALDRLIPEEAAMPVSEQVTAEVPDNSIAVLPFVNMSADEENAYFSDGLSEELLNLLAKIPELRVAARTSAFSFRDSDADISEIAGKLNVAHVLEGSVRKSGQKIRITAQLIDGDNGYHLWSETWDRDLVDIFVIQDEIATTVVDQLKLKLLGEVPRAYETDVEAFELELRARAAANSFTREGLEEAQALTTQALAIDPNYADAWYNLSIIYSNMVSRDFMTPTDGFENAQAAALRALEIDPNHAKALSSLGWTAMYSERDTDKAAGLMKRALETAPGDPRVLNAYATMLSAFGRADESGQFLREAVSRDPLSVPVLSNLAILLADTGRFDEAREVVDRMRTEDPESYLVARSTAWLNWREGNLDEAISGFAELPGVIGTWGLALAYHDIGDDGMSDKAIEDLGADTSSLFAIAGAYAYRGENDAAFEYLERAMQSDTDAIMEVRMYPVFDPVHDDPRWEPLLAQLGLSDSDAERLGI